MANLYNFKGIPQTGKVADSYQLASLPSGRAVIPFAGGDTTALVIGVIPTPTWAPGTIIFDRATNFTVEYSCSAQHVLQADRDAFAADPESALAAIWHTVTPAQMMQILSRITAIRITNTSTDTDLVVEWVI